MCSAGGQGDNAAIYKERVWPIGRSFDPALVSAISLMAELGVCPGGMVRARFHCIRDCYAV